MPKTAAQLETVDSEDNSPPTTHLAPWTRIHTLALLISNEGKYSA